MHKLKRFLFNCYCFYKLLQKIKIEVGATSTTIKFKQHKLIISKDDVCLELGRDLRLNLDHFLVNCEDDFDPRVNKLDFAIPTSCSTDTHLTHHGQKD